MWFEIRVGLGELLDRLIIARLRQRRFEEPLARAIATRDVEALETILTDRMGPVEEMESQARVAYGALSSLNRRVWDLETRVRYAPRTESVDPIAREIRMLNDVRSAIKVSVDVMGGNVETLGKIYRGSGDDLERLRRAPPAVLFDLDGVLADTERLKAAAHVQTVAVLGGRLSEDFYAELLGRSQRDVATTAIERSGVNASLDQYNAIFGERYLNLIRQGIRPVVGALDLVARVRECGLRLCLVTSSSLALATEVLASIGVDIELFTLVTSGDDSPRHKPSSEPYLSVLQALWIDPDRTLAIEDTAPGVASASKVGVPVVAVRHVLNARHDFGAARYIVDTLADDRLQGDVCALSKSCTAEM